VENCTHSRIIPKFECTILHYLNSMGFGSDLAIKENAKNFREKIWLTISLET